MQEDKAEYERFALKEEEHQKLKSLYRTLLERGLEDEQYFQKARQAYMENDADELKKLTDKEVCVKEDVDHASLLQALEENIQRLLSSFWLSQEDLLLSQEKSYLGPLQEECRYYQQTKDEMTSLYYRAGN